MTMIKKTIAVCQMATVLGWTMTAVRESPGISSHSLNVGNAKAKKVEHSPLIKKVSDST